MRYDLKRIAQSEAVNKMFLCILGILGDSFVFYNIFGIILFFRWVLHNSWISGQKNSWFWYSINLKCFLSIVEVLEPQINDFTTF